MIDDLFESLDSAGFGSNVHEVAAQGECRVLRLDDETGELIFVNTDSAGKVAVMVVVGTK